MNDSHEFEEGEKAVIGSTNVADSPEHQDYSHLFHTSTRKTALKTRRTGKTSPTLDLSNLPKTKDLPRPPEVPPSCKRLQWHERTSPDASGIGPRGAVPMSEGSWFSGRAKMDDEEDEECSENGNGFGGDESKNAVLRANHSYRNGDGSVSETSGSKSLSLDDENLACHLS